MSTLNDKLNELAKTPKVRIKSSTLNPDDLYQYWLKHGLSLRKIGRIYGVSRTTVQEVIRRKYGKQATNPRMNGFARVVAQEYPDNQELLQKSFNKPGRYLTTRKEQNLSTFQSIGFLDNYAEEQQEYEEGLRLPLFIWFCDSLVGLLGC